MARGKTVCITLRGEFSSPDCNGRMGLSKRDVLSSPCAVTDKGAQQFQKLFRSGGYMASLPDGKDDFLACRRYVELIVGGMAGKIAMEN